MMMVMLIMLMMILMHIIKRCKDPSLERRLLGLALPADNLLIVLLSILLYLASIHLHYHIDDLQCCVGRESFYVFLHQVLILGEAGGCPVSKPALANCQGSRFEL